MAHQRGEHLMGARFFAILRIDEPENALAVLLMRKTGLDLVIFYILLFLTAYDKI